VNISVKRQWLVCAGLSCICLSAAQPAKTPAAKAADDQEKIVSSWPLTFTNGEALSYDAQKGSFSSTEPSKATIDILAEAFNKMYPAQQGEPSTVVAAGNSLIIRGTREDVFQIKEALAKWIDVPYEQVRLDLWVFRASQRKDAEKQLSERIGLIRRGIAIARAYQKFLVGDLERQLRRTKLRPLYGSEGPRLLTLYPQFGLGDPLSNVHPLSLQGFDAARDHIRPLIDDLSYLPFLDAVDFREQIGYRTVDGKAPQFLKTAEQEVNNIEVDPRLKDQVQAKQYLQDLVARLCKSNRQAFSIFTSLVATSGEPDGNALLNYLESYSRCDRLKLNSPDFVDPEKLSLTASTADTLIANAVDAVTADMRKTVIEPLQAWIQHLDSDRSLLLASGQTTINVTSTTAAGTYNIGQGYLPYTAPSKLDANGIQGIVDGLKGEALTSSAGLLGLVKVLSGLSPTATTFTKLENGLSMSVRPTVLPGARAARLQIEVASTTDVGKQSGDANPTDQLIDNLKSQHLITDVQVEGFDLFELSTLALDHTGPGDYRWQIPFLDGLPLIGGAFRGPRSTLTTTHRALVIVQVTIIPKSLQITRRYVKGL
jgi:hypothetical protein